MIALALDILTTAAILFIVAAGLLIVFGVMKIINFAHGAFMTVGAYAALVTSNLALPAILAPFLAFVLGGCLAPLPSSSLCGGSTSARSMRSWRPGDSASSSGSS